MRRMMWLCCLMLAGHLAGCASLPPPSGDANDRIDDYLAQREYRKAMTVLAELNASSSPANENLQEIQARIGAHIAGFESRVVSEADSAMAANEWGEAFDLYRDALSRLPDSQRLQQGQQRLLQRHAEHLEKLDLERLIAKGEWTLKDLEISKLAAAHNAHGWLGQYSVHRKIAAADQIALELAERGKRSLEQKDYTAAERVLPLAVDLSNVSEIKALNARLHEMRTQEEVRVLNEQRRVAEAQAIEERARAERQDKKQRATIRSQEQKKTKRLMAEFKKACREKNFVQAQKLMVRLEKQQVDDLEFERLREQLAGDVARHVKQLIRIGVIHYSQQEYDEAVSVWKQAQVLDPDNEQLAARIKRATRVTEKLQNLRTKNGNPK
jgi:tetratricopeptide (TPR) repeat protein